MSNVRIERGAVEGRGAKHWRNQIGSPNYTLLGSYRDHGWLHTNNGRRRAVQAHSSTPIPLRRFPFSKYINAQKSQNNRHSNAKRHMTEISISDILLGLVGYNGYLLS